MESVKGEINKRSSRQNEPNVPVAEQTVALKKHLANSYM